ncbi:hypothetical protein [Amycolatopsis pigmentata]|uniref:Cell division protein FtsL n=1 Tax=Amycolatopsis pigmentata TaxID=450801 RepID=A0ABW5G5J6_9PSEU
MTAPARTRRKPQPDGAAAAPVTERRSGTRRTLAAERAYARRAQRVEGIRRAAREPERTGGFRLRWPRSRASFVLIVMVLLAAGVVVTLLLSTQAIADSYRLEQIRQENANLAERSERLQQDVNSAGSASSLAERAKALGMVPAGDPAHLVRNPDGSITVVGEPEKVTAPETAAPPPSSPPPAPGALVEGDVPQGDQASSAQPAGR